jgi:tetratricopeptide (TPR) repeat protein
MNLLKSDSKLSEDNLFNSYSRDSVWKEFSEGLLSYRMSKNRLKLSKKNKLLKRAIKKFTHFISLVPDYNPAYGYLGISYYQMGELNLALKSLNEAISRSEKKHNFNLILYRGIVYHKLSDNKKALADFSYLVNNSCENLNAYYHRAILFWEEKRYKDAIVDLTKAINILLRNDIYYTGTDLECPPTEQLRKLRAECYLRIKDYRNAITDYSKILETDYDNETLFSRGKCSYFLNNWDDALADLRLVAKNDPYQHEAFYLCGEINFELLKYENAIEDFTKSISLLLNNVKAYIRRAWAYCQIGCVTEALKDLATAKDLDPENAELYRIYGVVFLNLRMPVKAIESFRISANLGDEISQEWLRDNKLLINYYIEE